MDDSTTRDTWTRRLLGAGAMDTAFTEEARRLVASMALASTFGAALGLRAGPRGMAVHAAGVATGMAAVCLLAVPALGIVLAIGNAKASGLELARASSRAAATAGLLLAGLAPGVALFAVTVEDAITVSIVGAGALALAGALGMRAFVGDVGPKLSGPDARPFPRVALAAFVGFAALLAARISWVTLPLLRGEP